MSNLINITNQQGNLVVSSRDLARNFEKEHFNVVRDIEMLEGNEPLKSEGLKYFVPGTYNHRGNEYKEYLLTRDGFTLLAMGFTGQKALQWKLKYIEAFNKMEQIVREESIPTGLSPELQVLINMELKQRELETAVTENKQEIEDMRSVIRLDTSSWRKESAELINKMAVGAGGFEHIRQIRQEGYDLLDARMGVSLATRLTNKRRRMADEGVSRSRREKLNYLDIIAEDKKLIEGYIAIVKEMAIKYKVA